MNNSGVTGALRHFLFHPTNHNAIVPTGLGSSEPSPTEPSPKASLSPPFLHSPHHLAPQRSAASAGELSRSSSGGVGGATFRPTMMAAGFTGFGLGFLIRRGGWDHDVGAVGQHGAVMGAVGAATSGGRPSVPTASVTGHRALKGRTDQGFQGEDRDTRNGRIGAIRFN
jgi:hypothetical protein